MQIAAAAVAATPTIIPEPERVMQPATLYTTEGLYVTHGHVELTLRSDGWRGALRGLDAPGAVASLYFGGAVRDVVLRLADGRRFPARLTDTRFGEGGRVYTIAGPGPAPAAIGLTA